MKPKFSILTLLLVTTLAACALVAVSSLAITWSHQRQATVLRQQIEQQKTVAARNRSLLEKEFFGAYPDALVLIDPRVDKANPWIFRVKNSKFRGGGGTYQVGPVGTDEAPLRVVRFDLRLLRSLDGSDYYRLLTSVDGGKTVENLIQYTGKTEVLVASKTVTIVMGPDAKSCIEAAMNQYGESDSQRLRNAWMDGPHQPIVREMNLTQQRPSVN
ncbi:MAG: hypothetical protein HKN47_14310 [Pirellulaceae bacterium]|nr:hypothetical protein [Pirellulaceae bacterium]